MLPPKLRALRHALRETHPGGSGETAAPSRAERRCAETLERAQAGESDAASARLTPTEFRKFYGYEPKESPRMRECAELLAYGGGGSRDHQRLDA